MKLAFKTAPFLLIFWLPSILLGQTFTNCGGNFKTFLKKAERYATEVGVSSEVLKKTIRHTKFNPTIIELDRKQRSFKLSFLGFSKRAINDYRLVNGKKKFTKHQTVFDEASTLYGVPKEVITAFWAGPLWARQTSGDYESCCCFPVVVVIHGSNWCCW